MNEDKLIQMVVENTEDIRFIKKQLSGVEIRLGKLDDIDTKLDSMVTILNRLDGEREVHSQAIMDLNDRVDNHDTSIKQIKNRLKIA